MEIADNILKHYLRNCYFINGTAYAGKSTMCALLAENPARLYGAYPRKGVIAPGSDADIVVLDPAARSTFSYSRYLVRNPTQLKMPLEKRLYSFIERMESTICRVIKRKSCAPSTISV